jgi:glycine/D-amino acid oxidase-like deaminating enzyme
MAAVDVIVIGGGCTGASTAFWLASRHRQRVVLLERRTVGGGPTGRSSGIVRMHYSYEPLIRLALRSREIFVRFDEIVGGNPDFRPTGFVIVAPPGQEATLAANVALQQRLGVDTILVDSAGLRDIEPRMRTDDVAAGAYEPGSGYADGHATTAAFAAAARRWGAEVREHEPAVRILIKHSRITGVEVPTGRLSARAVLVAAGPWTREILAPLGIAVPIRATRHQVVTMEVPEGTAPLRHVFADLGLGIYTRPDVGGQFLAGSIEESPEEEVDPDAFNEAMDFAFAERIASRLAARIPAFADVGVRSGYASLYDVTPDWQPILGPVPDVEGLYIAAGFSGHGFKLSPAIGEAMAGLIATGRFDVVDLGLFRLSRFAEGALIHSAYAHGIAG